MIISLLGYMGCGKTHVSKLLSEKLDFEYVDLDAEISKKNRMPVSDIFEKKGEIYFRKQEREVLEELLAAKNNAILSMGGGTPCYYNNMEALNHRSLTFFLMTPVPVLTDRLRRHKIKRPLIAKVPDGELQEFIAKHLFERNPYYSQARYTINCAGKSPDQIAEEITSLVF